MKKIDRLNYYRYIDAKMILFYNKKSMNHSVKYLKKLCISRLKYIIEIKTGNRTGKMIDAYWIEKVYVNTHTHAVDVFNELK